jgi:hypothetical protein
MLLSSHRESIEKAGKSSKLLETIQSYSERYARYQTIEFIVKSSRDKDFSLPLGKHVSEINLFKDYTHIVHLAYQHNISIETLGKKIQIFQQRSRQQIWSNLCKDHPVLAEYEKLVQQFAKTQGYRRENLQKTIQNVVMRITNDSSLPSELQRSLPKLAKNIIAYSQSCAKRCL